MPNVCDLTPEVPHEALLGEPLRDEPGDEPDEPDAVPVVSRPVRVFACVGAWLVERFANVPGPFIEDGRLAAHSRDLQSPRTTETLVH